MIFINIPILKYRIKENLKKSPFIVVNILYLVSSLVIPLITSGLYIYLKDVKMEKGLADISLGGSFFIIIGIMIFANNFSPNVESFKEEINKEFLSYHSFLKSAVIYILAVALISSSNSQSFGTALLIPYYMFVINFYTSISSGEIKKSWF